MKCKEFLELYNHDIYDYIIVYDKNIFYMTVDHFHNIINDNKFCDKEVMSFWIENSDTWTGNSDVDISLAIVLGMDMSDIK